MKKFPYVFTDRDGTLTDDPGYLNDPKGLIFFEGILDSLKILSDHGYRLVLVSNQSGVGRGLITEEQFQKVHEAFEACCCAHGIEFAHYLYCFHHPKAKCLCRKPGIALVSEMINFVDVTSSYMIGDKLCDVEFGNNLNLRSLHVLSGCGEQESKLVGSGTSQFKTFNEAVERIINPPK